MQSFMKKCQEISFKVLSCFALGLGFDEDFFTKVRFSVALDLYGIHASAPEKSMARLDLQTYKQGTSIPRA